MASELVEIIRLQREFQESLGFDFHKMSMPERIQFIKEMHTAAQVELVEVLDEVTWKPWSSAKPTIDSDGMTRELIDVMHFWLNLLFAAQPNMTPETYAERILFEFKAKQVVNRVRQNVGYDNTNKCPRCKRALDDMSLLEVQDDNGEYVTLCKCGQALERSQVPA